MGKCHFEWIWYSWWPCRFIFPDEPEKWSDCLDNEDEHEANLEETLLEMQGVVLAKQYDERDYIVDYEESRELEEGSAS